MVLTRDNDLFYCFKDNWFSTCESIKLRNQINVSKLHIPTNPPINLLNLKYLGIASTSKRSPISLFLNASIFENFLNKLKKLHILQLYNIETYSDIHLRLKDLKALSIQNIRFVSIYRMVIDAPKLHSLDMNETDHNQIEFKHPFSIKYLRSDYYNKEISKFINLECLEFDRYSYLNSDDLLMFNNLKKIKFNQKNYMHLKPKDKAELKDLFRLKKDGLEMVLGGVKIKEHNKIDEYKINWSALVRCKFQLENYGELDDNLNFENTVEYNRLLDLSPNNQPQSDIFKKYTNIRKIIIEKRIENENQLINFIKKCHNLYDLDAAHSSLSQEFYDQLPAITLLTKLTTFERNINFKFIEKMSHLMHLDADIQDNLHNEDINLNELKSIKKILYRINHRPFVIIKQGKDKYYTDWKYYFNLNELTEWSKLKRTEVRLKIDNKEM